MTVRVGLGYDIHPFAADRALVLGGVSIDGPGLAGHSDADAVAHAVADALLGPAGLPDLGTLFPASDERHRGVESNLQRWRSGTTGTHEAPRDAAGEVVVDVART